MSIEFHNPVWDEGDVWREESWTFHSSPEVDRDNPIAVDFCFYEDGVHYPGRYCPHEEDNMSTNVGWTAQSSHAWVDHEEAPSNTFTEDQLPDPEQQRKGGIDPDLYRKGTGLWITPSESDDIPEDE